MAKVIVGGVDYEIAPYSLYDLQQAAPAIDKLRAFVGNLPDDPDERMAQLRELSLARGLDLAGTYVEALLPGIVKIDETMTLDKLLKSVSFVESQALSTAWLDVQREAGMMAPAGEPQPASPPETPSETMTEPASEAPISDPTATKSETSSASSLPPVVDPTTPL